MTPHGPLGQAAAPARPSTPASTPTPDLVRTLAASTPSLATSPTPMETTVTPSATLTSPTVTTSTIPTVSGRPKAVAG
jgi:hypothetical protein